MCQFLTKGPFESADAFSEYTELHTSMLPKHPVAQRVVTTHGDLHPGNMLEMGDGVFSCIDFEFSCVTSAAYDLKYSMNCCNGKENKLHFLRGYVNMIGQEHTNLEELYLDLEISSFQVMHQQMKLSVWDVDEMTPDELVSLIHACEEFANDARVPGKIRDCVLEHGGAKALAGHPVFRRRLSEAMYKGEQYQRLQKDLDECTPEPQLGPEPLMQNGTAKWIKPVNDDSLAVQVRPGTSRLELALWDGSPRQQWLFSDKAIQHAETGLYLDADVEYIFNKRGAPWESASALSVKPWVEGSERQHWVMDGQLIRHQIGGQCLDVNFWELKPGRGVNMNTPHSDATGCSWLVQDVEDLVQSESDESEVLQFVEFGLPEPKSWHDWCKRAAESGCRLPTVYELKAAKAHTNREWGDCWVPVTLTGTEHSDPFVKFTGRVDGALVAGENLWACLDSSRPYVLEYPKWGLSEGVGTAPREAFFMASSTLADTVNVPSKEVAPIADVPVGVEFHIAVAKAPEFCLAVGSCAKNPSTVKLAAIKDGDSKQKWTLEGDRFRNVDSGEYLDASTQYAFVHDIYAPWHRNHSHLQTAPCNNQDSQRWVLGPEEFHGGKVLRHYLDGRAVDVHGWNFKHGGNMGLENSVHGDCDGVSYVLLVA